MQEFHSKREANKLRKRAAILRAAETVFFEKGFEGASIDEVIQRAGLTKRTLYQYFQSKEDLYYAVALKGAQLLFEASMTAIERGENAREKIRLVNLAHLDFYKEHFAAFRILNYVPANRENCGASPHYQQIMALDARRMEALAALMAEGLSDGSINPALDMKKAVLFGFYAAFSMLYTLAFTDKGVWETLRMDEEEFLRFSFDRFAQALQGEEGPHGL